MSPEPRKNEIEEIRAMLKNHMHEEEGTMTSIFNEIRDFRGDFQSDVKEIRDELQKIRDEVTPILELWNNGSGFYKVFMWSFKTVAIIAAGLGALLFIKKL